jgi:hypothetical protein
MGRMGRRGWAVGILGATVALVGGMAVSSSDGLDDEPINYSKTPPQDPIAKLQQRIDKGEAKLTRDPARGYLPAVLRALGIPVSSQMLVFSKTSFQRDRIAPSAPRAIYFDDTTYIGWVQGGPVLEVSSTDPQLGGTYYTLDQSPAAKPKFMRQTYECLSCHTSPLTKGVPGHFIRSLFVQPDGQPLFQAGTYLSSDESPLKERWGGWYVTGSHGKQEHMGNIIVRSAEAAENPDLSAGANVTNLSYLINTEPYLTKHSDIVALMVAEHQTTVQNLITRATYEAKKAIAYEDGIRKDLGIPEGERLQSTISRIKSVGEPLVRALFYCKEALLTEPVKGTSTFAADFSKRGPRDSKGRSLRDLDLSKRLQKYPLSYQVYTPQFDGLHPLAAEYIHRRIREVLSGQDKTPEFEHLTSTNRQNILEILRETKPELMKGL